MGKTQDIGKAAEEIACNFLRKKGLRLVSRNFCCRAGEIDLIMQDSEHLVFVEVRYRKTQLFGGGVASISYGKQQKILKTAHYYLLKNKLHERVACRFDVIAVSELPSGQHIEWIENAF